MHRKDISASTISYDLIPPGSEEDFAVNTSHPEFEWVLPARKKFDELCPGENRIASVGRMIVRVTSANYPLYVVRSVIAYKDNQLTVPDEATSLLYVNDGRVLSEVHKVFSFDQELSEAGAIEPSGHRHLGLIRDVAESGVPLLSSLRNDS